LLDHVFITVKDLDRSIAFYETALKPLGIVHAIDYDGKDGPEGHPDLKGFGRDGRVFFWLRQGEADARAAHIGFVAKSEAEANAFYEAAMAAGATDNGKPARACITIPVITLRTFSIPTVTVSRRSPRAGNTANDRASKFQRAPTCADAGIVTRSPMTGKLIRSPRQ
jgi:catechol 2,3-dioxygenase-like lactoylglutathione lyase family enzyme